MRKPWLSLVALALVAGCRPEAGDPASLVSGARILAVRGEPAEAKPGEEVTYDVLVASPSGTITDPAAYWSLCLTPKPLTENNAVNRDCWQDAYVPFGGPGAEASTTTPKNACQLFGPETPPGDLRPRDPDVTGGFYLPVRVAIPELAAFGFERITCGLTNTSADVTLEYRDRYVANTHPELTELAASVDGAAVALDAIPAGTEVHLAIGWTPASVETFPVLDIGEQRLVDQTERMRVSWFATAGELESDRTGAEGSGAATTNVWRAPDAAGAVHLWVVLRDSRGGVDFRSYDAAVK